MKRIAVVFATLFVLLAVAVIGRVPAVEADEVYEALIQYFHGEIDKSQLESILAPPPPATATPAFTQTLGELGDSHADATTCGGKPHPIHEAFQRDPLGTDWEAYEAVYCNLETGQWVTGRVPRAGVDYARDDQLIGHGAAGYNATCYYTNSAGERAPVYQTRLTADGELERNADGSIAYNVYHGSLWDPIAQRCVGRTIKPARS